MGILWSTAFFIRKNYPAVLVYMYKTIPFAWAIRNYQPLVTMTQYIIEGIEIEQMELDCSYCTGHDKRVSACDQFYDDYYDHDILYGAQFRDTNYFRSREKNSIRRYLIIILS